MSAQKKNGRYHNFDQAIMLLHRKDVRMAKMNTNTGAAVFHFSWWRSREA